MTDPDDTPLLADLNVDKVRNENDHVDNRIAELESKVEDLQSDVATLEDEKETLETEKEAATELLNDFQDSQRDKQLARLKEANEQLSEDKRVDLSTLEDASADQLETTADLLESAAGTTQVDNTDSSPEFGSIETGDDSVDLESAKRKAAEESGLGNLYADLGTDESSSEPTAQDLIDAVSGDQ